MAVNVAPRHELLAPYQREPALSELMFAAVRAPAPIFGEWCAQDKLALRTLMTQAVLTEEVPSASPDRQVLRGDEVTLEHMSMALAAGPVSISLSEEQGRYILEHHREDAFPSG